MSLNAAVAASQQQTTSGKIVICVVLLTCGCLVSIALWQRSHDTSRIRSFWTGAGAHAIQQGSKVEFARLTPGSELTDLPSPRDVSFSPGLVHLRATLVDDRYFDWTSNQAFSLNAAQLEGGRLFRFVLDDYCAELLIDVASGTVYSLATKQSVRLIPASRAAVREYLRSW